MKIRRPIIALDYSSTEDTMAFLSKFTDEHLFVKIGMELFYAEGQDIVKRVQDMGHDVFLDLKCHDIPHTVYRAMRVIGSLGIKMTTVHALGGSEMMRAAREGLNEGAAMNGFNEPRLIAITQLTSTDQRMIKKEQMLEVNLQESVLHLAELAHDAELAGVVCSGYEAELIAQRIGEKFLRVTPGIRLEQDSFNDQKRVMTPQLAAENDASAIVVGRSITQADDPEKTYKKIQKLWEQNL